VRLGRSENVGWWKIFRGQVGRHICEVREVGKVWEVREIWGVGRIGRADVSAGSSRR
jgi:hypothetical protein